MNGVRITTHARQRMAEMGLTVDEVVICVTTPEVCYQQPRYGPRDYMAQRGKIAAAYTLDSNDTAIVKTVMPRTQERYER